MLTNPLKQAPIPTTHNLNTIRSNQWYSSLYKGLPSQPLYALPLAFQLTSKGLGLSSPEVSKQPNTIYATFVEDFVVGTDKPFTNSHINKISDWSVNISLSSANNQEFNFTLAHGIPFTKITSQENLSFQIPNNFFIYPDNQTQPVEGENLQVNNFVLTTRNHSYIIVLDQNASLSKTTKQINTTSKNAFIGLLDDRTHYQNFLDVSSAQVLETQATYEIKDQKLLTTYKVGSTDNKNVLITLYPHQKEFLNTKMDILGTYQTLRGPLSLIAANSFTTSIPLTTPSKSFPSIKTPTSDLIEQVKKDTQTVLTTKPPDSADYYLGTYFGKVTSLIQLADMLKLDDEKNKLTDFLEPLFLKSLSSFYYDPAKTSLIASKSEFGNDMLNDHHFHYGYYIRTAAVLGSYDKNFLKKVEPQIKEMVQDIANTDKANTQYPYVRNFDSYEGHSWADGYAQFNDGNNQESTSEAMNAWYALYLWGDLVKDKNLETLALYLFNTEKQSTFEYWFNKENIYSKPYNHQIASLVWGGKVDYATWFSNETNMIYGIQLLPFTPASFYLSELPDVSKYETDYLANGGSFSNRWGDLFIMFKSFSKPEQTLELINRDKNFQEDNLRSLYLYFLYYNSQSSKN